MSCSCSSFVAAAWLTARQGLLLVGWTVALLAGLYRLGTTHGWPIVAALLIAGAVLASLSERQPGIGAIPDAVALFAGMYLLTGPVVTAGPRIAQLGRWISRHTWLDGVLGAPLTAIGHAFSPGPPPETVQALTLVVLLVTALCAWFGAPETPWPQADLIVPDDPHIITGPDDMDDDLDPQM